MMNLIILFPGLAGGNHLANLLSTNENFQPRFKSENYLQELIKLYHCKTIDAHLTDYTSDMSALSIMGSKFITDRCVDGQKFNILNGHLFEYLAVQHIIDPLPEKKYIVVTDENKNIYIKNRFRRQASSNQNDTFLADLGHNANKIYYTENVISKLTLAPATDIFTVHTDFIFTENLLQLKEILMNYFGIVLPAEADTIHKIWFDNIINRQ